MPSSRPRWPSSKRPPRGDTSFEDRDHAIRQLVSRAIVPNGQIIDVFAAAGLKRPGVSILDEAFLAEVKAMPHKNLAVELLQRLLKEEINEKCKRNAVQTKTFSEMLRQSVQRYHNRAITTQEIFDEMIRMAKELREAHARGEQLGPKQEKLAFYDALAQNDSAVQVLGVDEL